MSSIFESFKYNYQLLMGWQANLAFLKEVMAAYTMVANAQGTIYFAERIRVDQIVNPYGG
jgi:hypothetical protein